MKFFLFFNLILDHLTQEYILDIFKQKIRDRFRLNHKISNDFDIIKDYNKFLKSFI